MATTPATSTTSWSVWPQVSGTCTSACVRSAPGPRPPRPDCSMLSGSSRTSSAGDGRGPGTSPRIPGRRCQRDRRHAAAHAGAGPADRRRHHQGGEAGGQPPARRGPGRSHPHPARRRGRGAAGRRPCPGLRRGRARRPGRPARGAPGRPRRAEPPHRRRARAHSRQHRRTAPDRRRRRPADPESGARLRRRRPPRGPTPPQPGGVRNPFGGVPAGAAATRCHRRPGVPVRRRSSERPHCRPPGAVHVRQRPVEPADAVHGSG